MVAFPDMRVLMDDLLMHGDKAEYRWTLVGTNTGPGGTGRRQISASRSGRSETTGSSPRRSATTTKPSTNASSSRA